MDTQKDKDGSYRIILPVRVTPKAAKNQIVPYQPDDESIQVKVTAVPEDGEANEAVIGLLSEHLKVPKTAISLVSGAKSRHKRFAIQVSGSNQNPVEFLRSLTAPLQADEEAWFNLLNP